MLSDRGDSGEKGPGQERGGRDGGTVEVLAETISESDPTSPRYQAGLHDDIRNDGQSIPVTEFTSSILAPTNRSGPLMASVSPGPQGKSNRSLRSFVMA